MTQNPQSVNDNYLAYLVKSTFNDFTSKQTQMFDTIQRRIQSQEDDIISLQSSYNEALSQHQSLFEQLNNLTCGGVVLDKVALQKQIDKHQKEFQETKNLIHPLDEKITKTANLTQIAQIQLAQLADKIKEIQQKVDLEMLK